jgi:hypothetical protein
MQRMPPSSPKIYDGVLLNQRLSEQDLKNLSLSPSGSIALKTENVATKALSFLPSSPSESRAKNLLTRMEDKREDFSFESLEKLTPEQREILLDNLERICTAAKMPNSAEAYKACFKLLLIKDIKEMSTIGKGNSFAADFNKSGRKKPLPLSFTQSQIQALSSNELKQLKKNTEILRSKNCCAASDADKLLQMIVAECKTRLDQPHFKMLSAENINKVRDYSMEYQALSEILGVSPAPIPVKPGELDLDKNRPEDVLKLVGACRGWGADDQTKVQLSRLSEQANQRLKGIQERLIGSQFRLLPSQMQREIFDLENLKRICGKDANISSVDLLVVLPDDYLSHLTKDEAKNLYYNLKLLNKSSELAPMFKNCTQVIEKLEANGKNEVLGKIATKNSTQKYQLLQTVVQNTDKYLTPSENIGKLELYQRLSQALDKGDVDAFNEIYFEILKDARPDQLAAWTELANQYPELKPYIDQAVKLKRKNIEIGTTVPGQTSDVITPLDLFGKKYFVGMPKVLHDNNSLGSMGSRFLREIFAKECDLVLNLMELNAPMDPADEEIFARNPEKIERNYAQKTPINTDRNNVAVPQLLKDRQAALSAQGFRAIRFSPMSGAKRCEVVNLDGIIEGPPQLGTTRPEVSYWSPNQRRHLIRSLREFQKTQIEMQKTLGREPRVMVHCRAGCERTSFALATMLFLDHPEWLNGKTVPEVQDKMMEVLQELVKTPVHSNVNGKRIPSDHLFAQMMHPDFILALQENASRKSSE